jgi:membrane protein DedA with SNARE-associated domain
MEHLQQLVVHLIDQWGYLGLFIGLMLGNIGAPVGAEVILPLSGALTATGHLANIWATIVIATAGELAGQSLAYAVGYYGGRPFVLRFGKYVRFREHELDRIDGFFARYGNSAIFICRFVPVLRGLVGIPAGIARMNLAVFYLWTLAGSLVFCGGLGYLGFVFGRHVDVLYPLLRRSGILIFGIVVVAVAVIALVWYLRNRKNGQTDAA